MDQANWLNSLIEFEEQIFFDRPASQGVSPYFHAVGQRPLLISAPHSTIHMRNGRIKRAEGYTGSLAHLLAKLSGAHAFYAQYKLHADPNWDRHSPYKSMLSRIIRHHDIQFVIDLHGMSNWHKFGIAVGTINGRSCPQQAALIKQTLISSHFQPQSEQQVSQLTKLNWQTFVFNHSRFTGGRTNQTITRFVSEKHGVGAVQFELCTTLRVVTRERQANVQQRFRGNPKALEQTIGTFLTLIDTLV